jgi:catechol 2,3-dioxygenase
VPTGHRIELYSEMALSDNGPMVRNPQIWREESHGMRETPFDPCGALGRICQHDSTTPFDALTRR